MPSLKDLRNRITSVKSTQKITSAMKLVAASKLRRNQAQAEASRPVAARMERMLGSLTGSMSAASHAPRLMTGTGRDASHLLVMVTSNRGLCGGFNGAIAREARNRIKSLVADGKTVRLICVGRKGRDYMKREYGDMILDTYTEIGHPRVTYADAEMVSRRIQEVFDSGGFDVCTLIYNKFRSAISQVVTPQQLIPLAPPQAEEEDGDGDRKAGPPYEFEPAEEQILAELLPLNLSTQIYSAFLESAASEEGARMTAMDAATRNAGDMIDRLTLVYNRTRQAMITKELIEIISGAEAV